MRKILTARAATLALCLGTLTGAFATPLAFATGNGDAALDAPAAEADGSAPVVRRYVVDQADMLNDEGELRITTALARLHKQQDAQVVVVTVDDLRGRDITEFSEQLAEHWDVAVDEAEPGMLVVVAPNDQKVKLHVGPGLEAWMPPEMVRHIIANYMFPSFSQRAYQDGVINGAAGIVAILGQETPIGPKIQENGERVEPQVVRTNFDNSGSGAASNAAAPAQRQVAQAAPPPRPSTRIAADATPGATGMPLWMLVLMPILILLGVGAVLGYQRFASSSKASSPKTDIASAGGFAS